MLCTEDVAHTIYNRQKGYHEVLQRLKPFRIGNIRQASSMVADEQVPWGDMKEDINKKIAQLMGE
eukprot:NODE_21110_length_768_cov_3.639626.p5 GENE.NODE_21110_length_768_cov_3.639626~~NODE_21110_length_768_cov_3.639626.p5  ORF type:complete len:65 (+),score=21.24 NODE_21110_length_768_cov_3.639626:221-415(+)